MRVFNFLFLLLLFIGPSESLLASLKAVEIKMKSLSKKKWEEINLHLQERYKLPSKLISLSLTKHPCKREFSALLEICFNEEKEKFIVIQAQGKTIQKILGPFYLSQGIEQ